MIVMSTRQMIRYSPPPRLTMKQPALRFDETVSIDRYLVCRRCGARQP